MRISDWSSDVCSSDLVSSCTQYWIQTQGAFTPACPSGSEPEPPQQFMLPWRPIDRSREVENGMKACSRSPKRSLFMSEKRGVGRHSSSTPTILKSDLSRRTVLPTLLAPPNSLSLSDLAITATRAWRSSSVALQPPP